MQNYDVLIIGASAAGLTAALTARRHCPGKSIAVLRSKQLVPIPCGIPYAFGVVGTPERNLIPADDLLSKNGITSVVGEAKEIDREAQQVLATSGEVFGYERLVIAVGSAPIIPPIPGVDQENVFAIKKDVPYLKEIASALDKAKNLCIIGGGFIGVEIAEECRRRRPDLGISIVEMRDHCLQLVYDEELSVQAEEILREQGISLVLGERVEALVGGGVVRGIRLASGRHVDADVVILGIGAMPSVSVAEAAGLEIGPTKGIQVNRYMQTTDPRIFACGDCAEKLSFFDGMPSGLKLASIAATEARIVGANLFRTSRVNPGVIGIYSTVLGDCAFAAAGLTQAAAIEKGYDVVVGESESVNRHPGCMPGACQLKVKLVFEAGSQVLIGGQVTGARSGGELINTIGACIHRRMTADDIATFQAGTHPALTASPVSYQLANAAEVAIQKVNALVSA